MPVVTLGIDPGLGGAIAIFDPTFSGVLDAPVVTVTGRVRGKTRHRREYDVPAMYRILREEVIRREWEGPCRFLCVIEQASVHPGEGVVTCFRIGYGAGLWHGLLTALGIPYRIVHPATWKKAMGLVGRDKAAVRLEAQRRWPMASLERVKDHGRAEAIFLAEYARLLVAGGSEIAQPPRNACLETLRGG